MKIIKVGYSIHLLPRHSIISLVSVDLFLFSKATDAAFRIKIDPAMQPNIVGFMLSFDSTSCWRAQERNNATLAAIRGMKH